MLLCAEYIVWLRLLLLSTSILALQIDIMRRHGTASGVTVVLCTEVVRYSSTVIRAEQMSMQQ
jgi:hypothetical protein